MRDGGAEKRQMLVKILSPCERYALTLRLLRASSGVPMRLSREPRNFRVIFTIRIKLRTRLQIVLWLREAVTNRIRYPRRSSNRRSPSP